MKDYRLHFGLSCVFQMDKPTTVLKCFERAEAARGVGSKSGVGELLHVGLSYKDDLQQENNEVLDEFCSSHW